MQARCRDDILSKALQGKEHPGRVIGVGFSVSQKDYFPRKGRHVQHSRDNKVARLQEELDALKFQMQEMQKQMAMQRVVEVQPVVYDASAKDSCTTPSFNIPVVRIEFPILMT